MRTEESPTRFVALTSHPTYKWITWGKKFSDKRKHYTFYPIYDWSYTDVWKAIFSNDWPYNRIYDLQYQHGQPVHNMRVSNIHHETAVHHLFYIQEVEPKTYEWLTKRLGGIDMAGKMGKGDYFVSDLPPMFTNWKEYRDFLLEKLIQKPEWSKKLRTAFDKQEVIYGDTPVGDKMRRVQITSILTNDWECIKLANWERAGAQYEIRNRKKGVSTSWMKE